jgi:anti-anti-sigma factor
MLKDPYPVRWAGPQAVVALPEHIDVSSAGQICEELLSVINRGATALIVDMTATISCDHAGAEAVVRAYRRAVISGTELRLVVAAPIVLRVLSLSGVDRLVSIYPSLEAATAASAPAAALAPVASLAGTGAGGQSPPPDGDGDGLTLAVLGELFDAFPDGVALAGGDGTIVLASRPLEEMFGYRHGELDGHLVESLIPAGFQAAHRHHWASCAQTPVAWPAATGAQLAGWRKDRTTFPAQISLSLVTTPAGHFTLTVIRDLTGPQQLADLARAAVAAEFQHRSRELLDTVITSLFHAGLSLQAATGLPAEATQQRIDQVLGHLDDAIRVIRDAAFAARAHTPPPYAAPRNGAN